MKADVRTVVIAFYAVNATCSPFFSLILQDHEFSITAIGHIISFSKMTTLFGTPALCSIADTMHCHTPLLLLIGFAMTTLMLLWYVLPYASETPTWSFWLTVMVLGAYNALKGSAAVIVDTIILKALDRQEEVAIVSPTTETEPLLEGSESAQEVPSSTSSSSAAYPLLRLWGSISYGCVALTTGLIVRAYISLSRPPPQPNEGSRGDTTVHKDSDDWAVTNPPSTTGVATTSRPYRIVILIHVMCLVFFCWNVYFILYRRLHLRDASPIRPTRTTSNKSEEFINGGLHASSSSLEPGVNSPAHVGNGESSTLTNNKKSAVDRRVSSPLLDMTAIQQARINQLYTGRAFTLRIYKRVLTDPRIFVVLTGVMALGMCETAFTIFLFPYARRQLGAPPQLMSCIMFIHMLSEIVAYRKCSELLLHCPKEYLFLTASLGYATKMYVYSTIVNPWWLLLVESLHGLCSSVNWATAVAHVNANVQHISRGFELEQQRLLDEMNALYDEGMWKHSHVRGVDAVEDSSVHEFSQAPIYAQEPRLHCPPLDLMSTTLSVLWFASIGIPGMTAGLVPTIITTLCGPSTTPIEVRLFGAMCVMCVLTGGFFLWCGRLGLLR